MNKAVIFDLDGTLIHSVPDIADNINLMLNEFGYKTLSEDEIKSHVGHGARNLVADCIGLPLTDEELDERLDFYNEKYTNSGSPKTRLFDGVKQMLKTLKDKGYKLAILTNKPQQTTDNVVKNYMSDLKFDKVVGQSGTVKCKPDKTATLAILKEFGVSKENAYFVGDGDADVLTAANSEIKCIAVLWGYSSKEKLEKFGANTFAEKPSDVVDIILGNEVDFAKKI